MRGAVKLLIGLGVIAGLLAGADRLAVGVAEDEAADKLVSSGRMSARPNVSIEGFPFLTQAVSGEFDGVRLTGDGVTVSDGHEHVALRSFEARLSGVAVSDSYRSATVRSGSGSGLVSYPDVSKLIAGNGLLGLQYAGPGRVKSSVPGGAIEGRLHSEGNSIIVDDLRLTGTATLLKGALADRLKPQKFTLTSLPAGLSLASATPRDDGLLLDFTGKDLKLIG
ncbi:MULTISPECIES: LmeA family phospholipid-binding protein [Kitasatospora]|uniref:DUF2993 family protein n=2 Tax=Kitasatospora TaxID=2063 RepID=A0ABT1IPH1_9ACTN|nr:DUF2993 domain-containing protein [Kitasatospora paracochleata]MCP2307025.1 hypothetical protein [Kitasatospora paracochleata]